MSSSNSNDVVNPGAYLFTGCAGVFVVIVCLFKHGVNFQSLAFMSVYCVGLLIAYSLCTIFSMMIGRMISTLANIFLIFFICKAAIQVSLPEKSAEQLRYEADTSTFWSK